MAALLGLFWRLLREGRLKVARGRPWQPEIGMEHASRGRRSGNKGVGARWRGRFRIFSARHCSRTKVSHAENSGMTMIFLIPAPRPATSHRPPPIVIPEFSGAATAVTENIRNLPRQRAGMPTAPATTLRDTQQRPPQSPQNIVIPDIRRGDSRDGKRGRGG